MMPKRKINTFVLNYQSLIKAFLLPQSQSITYIKATNAYEAQLKQTIDKQTKKYKN